jgi:hypothetical protein
VLFNKGYLSDWRNEVLMQLAKESDSTQMYRLQGELRAIDSLTTLPHVVKEHIKGVNNGTQKKIGEEDAKHVQK